MEPHVCEHQYDGPDRRREERREKDRRQECLFHAGFQTAIRDITHDIEGLEKNVNEKAPMKLFYTTAAGVIVLMITILAFQWTTYERVGAIGLSHAKAMGAIKVEIQKITSTVESNQKISQMVDDQLANTLESHVRATDKTVGEINKSLKEIEHHLKKNGG